MQVLFLLLGPGAKNLLLLLFNSGLEPSLPKSLDEKTSLLLRTIGFQSQSFHIRINSIEEESILSGVGPVRKPRVR